MEESGQDIAQLRVKLTGQASAMKPIRDIYYHPCQLIATAMTDRVEVDSGPGTSARVHVHP